MQMHLGLPLNLFLYVVKLYQAGFNQIKRCWTWLPQVSSGERSSAQRTPPRPRMPIAALETVNVSPE